MPLNRILQLAGLSRVDETIVKTEAPTKGFGFLRSLGLINESSDMSIAQEILRQLGGHRFLTMTGAKNLLSGPNYLVMNLPPTLTKGRINKFKIELDQTTDSYTLTAMKYRKLEVKGVEKVENIDVTNLKRKFTEMTGLDVHI
jgi:hypothetical protein